MKDTDYVKECMAKICAKKIDFNSDVVVNNITETCKNLGATDIENCHKIKGFWGRAADYFKWKTPLTHFFNHKYEELSKVEIYPHDIRNIYRFLLLGVEREKYPSYKIINKKIYKITWITSPYDTYNFRYTLSQPISYITCDFIIRKKDG